MFAGRTTPTGASKPTSTSWRTRSKSERGGSSSLQSFGYTRHFGSFSRPSTKETHFEFEESRASVFASCSPDTFEFGVSYLLWEDIGSDHLLVFSIGSTKDPFYYDLKGCSSSGPAYRISPLLAQYCTYCTFLQLSDDYCHWYAERSGSPAWWRSCLECRP